MSYKQSDSPDYKENNAVKVESKHGIKIHYIVTNLGEMAAKEFKAEGK